MFLTSKDPNEEINKRLLYNHKQTFFQNKLLNSSEVKESKVNSDPGL